MTSASASSSWRSSSSSTKESEAQSCEIICNMLAMLSCSEKLDAHRTLLAMTNTPESCQSLRRAGCIPLLIQILHPSSLTPVESHPSAETKLRASQALKNIVHFNPDKKMKRKESSILMLLEAIRGFTASSNLPETEKHPTRSSTSLMKHSFDQEHKSVMCTLGAIHSLAELIVCDHKIHGSQTTDSDCILTRRYSCMTLTNLTFGDSMNKALLCSMNEFLHSLVAQLECENEEVVHVTASVLRNLSWHADPNSRAALRDSNAVSGLTRASLRATKEPTLEATLSALWNLSAHSSVNKAAICSTPNALQFLISLLNRNKSTTIVENSGGILRNISSHITGVDEYRTVLCESHCFKILLEHLKSSSLTIVSNACGTLWNLSGHPEEQQKLLELNAVPMLKNLMYSKHERISEGASAALRNLLSYYEHTNHLQKHQSQNYIHNDQENEQPLDLTITSCKSSPVRKVNPPPFLNPPISNGSVSSTRSCPDIQLKQTQPLQPNQEQLASPPLQQHQQKMEASSEDATFNYSHYDEMEEAEEEEEKHQQKDTVKTYCDEGTPGFSGSMNDISSQVVDSFIQFQVEDTPAVFSRTSSLSSIEENLQSPNQHGENRAEKIQEIKKASSVPIPCTGAGTGIGPILVTNTTSTSVVYPSVPAKRVMFSAEETPLMFSRCSSVASLESCGDLNNGRCESDCVSEFSRRTSEVVSPSELPDSPRAVDQDQIVSPPDPPQEQEKAHFVEVDPKNKLSSTSTNDELKVFAMEGTPFLISTATSLSDIVGELDNQQPNISVLQKRDRQIPTEPSEHQVQTSVDHAQNQVPAQTIQQAEQQQQEVQNQIHCLHEELPRTKGGLALRLPATLETEAEEPIYSDDQLLQKVIKVGRAVGMGLPKRLSLHIPQSSEKQPSCLEGDDYEVDLTHLIQRGRAKLAMTRSEDNLKQYTNFSANGSLPSSNQSQRISKVHHKIAVNKATNSNSLKTVSLLTSKSVDAIAIATCNLSLTTPPRIENNSSQRTNGNLVNCVLTTATSTSQSVTMYVQDPVESRNDDLEQTEIPLTAAKKNDNADDLGNDITDDTDEITEEISQSDEKTWTDETLSFTSPIPSMSINKAMKKVVGEMVETLSEIEEPTLRSLGSLDSAAIEVTCPADPHCSVNNKSTHGVGLHHTQNVNLQSSSSQVSNLMNQKPPQDFVDLDLEGSMISVASIRSEIFDDGTSPCAPSPQLVASSPLIDSHSLTNSPSQLRGKHALLETPSPLLDVKLGTPSLKSNLKYATYVIKRMESPKDRRRNNPDRYLTRTIEKTDLKMKPTILPPPLQLPLNDSTSKDSFVTPVTVVTTTTPTATATTKPTTTTTVRPTRASELRASRSREHSPTNSTTGRRTPPKPPVRSTSTPTPQLNTNTSLPRNAKLGEIESMHIIPSARTRSMVGSSHPSKDLQPKEKLNFGGRIGNLFRKSFSKHTNSKKQLKHHENISSSANNGNVKPGSKNMWAKNREKEKCLVSPFNYKPPVIIHPNEQLNTFASVVIELPASSSTTANNSNASTNGNSIPNSVSNETTTNANNSLVSSTHMKGSNGQANHTTTSRMIATSATSASETNCATTNGNGEDDKAKKKTSSKITPV